MPHDAPNLPPLGPIESLFRAHYLGLVRLSAQLVDDVATAEDVVQEVFARVQARASRILTVKNPLSYLRTAVLNESRSVLRRRRTFRAIRHLLPGLDRSSNKSPPDYGEQKRLKTFVAQLPPRQRELIVLRYFQDLTVTEVAQILEISSGAVSSSATVALASLSAMLGETHARTP